MKIFNRYLFILIAVLKYSILMLKKILYLIDLTFSFV